MMAVVLGWICLLVSIIVVHFITIYGNSVVVAEVSEVTLWCLIYFLCLVLLCYVTK